MGMNIARLPSPANTLIRRLAGWLYRYAPSEILGTATALTAAGLAAHLGGTMMLIAVAGAWGEVLGFYIPMVAREYAGTRQGRPLLAAIARTMRNLLLEFGMAEVLDTALLRPGLMLLAMQLIGPAPYAIVAGKLAADIFFYGLAICGYELRQRLDALLEK